MDVQTVKIEKLEDLVGRYISKTKKIIEKKITPLTAPGENFGSTILKVDLVVQNEDKTKEDLSMVAKLIPTMEFFREMFNVKVTFKIETAFYDIIVPTLQDFQREQGMTDMIDFFPKFYGARMNLDGSDNIDNDAIILLENLKVKGYYNVDRQLGCNLETTKLILKDLAQFHAVPIALKMKKPKIFEEKVKKYMACFQPPLPPVDKSYPNGIIMAILRENPVSATLIPKVEKSSKYDRVCNTKFREPFASISHQDLWVNNFMVKSEGQKIVSNKFVDFQTCTYDSPVRDLLFFLFTSVQFDVLKEKLDYLLEYYHTNFVKTLEDLGCQSTDFSEEKFFEELSYFGEYEIHHILFMYLLIVTAKKGGKPPSEDGPQGVPGLPTPDEVPLEIKEKAWWILYEFEKRNWLGN